MSALRWQFVTRLIDCSVFDNDLLRVVEQGVAQLPSTPHRVRIPCTLDMINHIINSITGPTATTKQFMLATGVAVAFFLCLRSSEYVSKTVVPLTIVISFAHQMSNSCCTMATSCTQ